MYDADNPITLPLLGNTLVDTLSELTELYLLLHTVEPHMLRKLEAFNLDTRRQQTAPKVCNQ